MTNASPAARAAALLPFLAFARKNAAALELYGVTEWVVEETALRVAVLRAVPVTEFAISCMPEALAIAEARVERMNRTNHPDYTR